jgi:hypothetical protein
VTAILGQPVSRHGCLTYLFTILPKEDLGPAVFNGVTGDSVRPVSQPLKFGYAYDSSTTTSPVLYITAIVPTLLFQTGAEAS